MAAHNIPYWNLSGDKYDLALLFNNTSYQKPPNIENKDI